MSSSDTDSQQSIAKVRDLIQDVETAMFVTTDAEGGLVSRPMAVQRVEFDGDLWFFTHDQARKVAQVRANPVVNVGFASKSTWVSVSGRAELLHDPAMAATLWNSQVEAWFPDGPTGAGVALLRVDADSAEYWDTPGAKVTTALSWVKKKTTGTPSSGGANETVEL